MLTIKDFDLTSFSSFSNEEIIEKYPQIGEGQSRTVYDLGNGLVLKISEEGDEYDNEKEFQVWTNASPELKQYLTPCQLDSLSHTRLFMLKAERIPVKRPEFEAFLVNHFGVADYTKLLNALYELSDEFRLVYGDLLLPQNWGIIDGEIKLIDYSLYLD